MGRIPWQEWKENFLLHQKAVGLAKRTLDDYDYQIALFFRRMKPTSPNEFKNSIIRYFADAADLSPYTFNHRRKKLKPFFQYLVDENIIPLNPMNCIKKRKEDPKPKAVPEDAS